MQVQTRIGGRTSASIDITRIQTRVDGWHLYSWNVSVGGKVRRGTCTHREERGELLLLWRVLYAYLHSVGLAARQ